MITVTTNMIAGGEGINLVGNPVSFTLSMNDVGDGVSVTRRCAYQLLTESGMAISAIEVYSPKVDEEFTIDFNKDVKELIYTAVPQVDDAWDVRPEPEMVMVVKLYYWELVTNHETCETTEENNAETIKYLVVNSAEQWWGYVNEVGAKCHLLSLVPPDQYLCPTLSNILYFFNKDAKNIIISVYDVNYEGPVPLYNKVYNPEPDTCFSLNINPQLLAIQAGIPLETIKRIRVFMDSVNVANYYIKGCCTEYRICFQTFGGGYVYLDFDKKESETVNTSFTEVKTYQPPKKEYDPTGNTTGGLRINDKKAVKQITLTRSVLKTDIDNIRFLEDFVASGNYYLQYRQYVGVGNDPDYLLFKRFILTSGSYRTYDSGNNFVFEITGYIAKDHKYPNYRI